MSFFVHITDRDNIEWEGPLAKVEEPVPPHLQVTHRVKTDEEIGRTNRPGMPMVFVWNNEHVVFTREWQYYLCACNPGMRLNNIAHMLANGVAFCNKTGVGSPAYRRNWILKEDLDSSKDPETDKTRTCGDAQVRWISGSVSMLDGSKPPLLKPGFVHPSSPEEALTAIDRYMYTPQANPEFFCPCTNVGPSGRANPWAHGALYPWYQNGTTPVTFFMHIARAGVTYPPAQWTENTPQLEALSM